ncbi:hypothetical protein [Pajaroellobacter abortibovis]|uniref:hypothetical protein n=1 Tax=Pajaroellobacter abortibovis TaxID=1882918 RepID=UPI0012EB3C94|nr:hypothetical protein [Pajaroellobacter abortibovis]
MGRGDYTGCEQMGERGGSDCVLSSGDPMWGRGYRYPKRTAVTLTAQAGPMLSLIGFVGDCKGWSLR